MSATAAQQRAPAPQSWAEDLQTYRRTRGSQAQGTVADVPLVKHHTRTHLMPLANPRHPLYSYAEPLPTCQHVLELNAERHARQGVHASIASLHVVQSTQDCSQRMLLPTMPAGKAFPRHYMLTTALPAATLRHFPPVRQIAIAIDVFVPCSVLAAVLFT